MALNEHIVLYTTNARLSLAQLFLVGMPFLDPKLIIHKKR